MATNEQNDHLLVSNYGRTWTPITPEGSQVYYQSFNFSERGKGKAKKTSSGGELGLRLSPSPNEIKQ